MSHCHDDYYDCFWHHCDHNCHDCDKTHECPECCDNNGCGEVKECMDKDDVMTLWNIICEKFARIVHSHSAEDIKDGVIPVERGGTGAKDKDSARDNLDAAKKDHRHDVDDIDNAAAEDHVHAVDDELSDTSKNPVENKVVTEALENKSDVGHTHNYGTDFTGTLPIEHGGTGATNAEKARENLNAAEAEHNHFSVTTVRQSYENVSQNQTLGSAGYIRWNLRETPTTESIGGINPQDVTVSVGGTTIRTGPDATINSLVTGDYLVSASVNYRAAQRSNVTIAVDIIEEDGTAKHAARSMALCESDQSESLIIPSQLIHVVEGDLIGVYVSQPGEVVTETGAALTFTYVSSGVW